MAGSPLRRSAVERAPDPWFAMFQFKVLPCCQKRPHEWKNCPFFHEGEKARRRDLRAFAYSPEPCMEFMNKKGKCPRGDACPLAHGVFETWCHSLKYKTVMCADGPECRRKVCWFAHTKAEQRLPTMPEFCALPTCPQPQQHQRQPQPQPQPASAARMPAAHAQGTSAAPSAVSSIAPSMPAACGSMCSSALPLSVAGAAEGGSQMLLAALVPTTASEGSLAAAPGSPMLVTSGELAMPAPQLLSSPMPVTPVSSRHLMLPPPLQQLLALLPAPPEAAVVLSAPPPPLQPGLALSAAPSPGAEPGWLCMDTFAAASAGGPAGLSLGAMASIVAELELQAARAAASAASAGADLQAAITAALACSPGGGAPMPMPLKNLDSYAATSVAGAPMPQPVVWF